MPDAPVLVRRSAAVEQLTDMSAYEEALKERSPSHWYPKDSRYRRSGCTVPQVGDVAYCGHVKDVPPVGAATLRAMPTCEPCIRLKRMVEGP